jgi:hypothetical protein
METFFQHTAAVFWTAITIIAVVPGVTIALAKAWCKNRQAEMDATLKMKMLEMGMSAEDIERVLRVQGGSAKLEGTCC